MIYHSIAIEHTAYVFLSIVIKVSGFRTYVTERTFQLVIDIGSFCANVTYRVLQVIIYICAFSTNIANPSFNRRICTFA